MALRVSLLGFGTVGQALAARLAGDPVLSARLQVVSVTDSQGTLLDVRGVDLTAALARKCAGPVGGNRIELKDVATWPGADVVVDLTPTDLRTAYATRDVAVSALLAGKHVVTANKGALALHSRALRDAQARSGARLLGSATVCGGTPVLELLASAFHGDRVERIEGVLNGSTNFLLSRVEQGAAWDEALGEARHLGILEADPSQDVLGHDAAAKAVILANAAWGTDLTLKEARVEGVLGVTPAEARAARSQGMAIRLVARATPGEVAVAPVTLPADHPLVADGRENTVRLKLAHAGTVTLRGPGAGGRETASAVLSDLLRLADTPQSPTSLRIASTRRSASSSVL